ncbi:hypothetical protein [Arthrospiribacter ruber]|uniref:DUF1566 domain-containing protein n=1 Tax=Arthrospiribacter ruber TaxID=2487934 RepID=A0A951IZ96_9BACT|nr:hypothetical protein [Arthrospiribacter ruber]MBW3468278.1 hypothetical protein [Arthrospiribacter ruber]
MRYVIEVNGQSFVLSNIKVGEIGKISIPLGNDFEECEEMNVEILQTGYGQPIKINENYKLVKKCEPLDLSRIRRGSPLLGGTVGSIPSEERNYYVVYNVVRRNSFIPWGCAGKLIDFSNNTISPTQNILNQCQELITAARLVDEYENDGFDDWELPTLEEFTFSSNFLLGLTFWTSKQVDKDHAVFLFGTPTVPAEFIANKSGSVSSVVAMRKVYID